MKPEIAKVAGKRLTLQKQAILDVLHAEEKMLTAEEVYGRVREKYPNVSLGTVYRNLQGFSAQGLLRRTLFADGKARFEMAGHIHHHHLICLGCGTVTGVPWCPIGPDVLNFLQESDFTPTSHQFEIYGYCSHCRQKNDQGCLDK